MSDKYTNVSNVGESRIKREWEMIGTELAKWEFDKSVAPVFNQHVRQSVPCYELFHKMIKDFSVFFVEPNTNVIDIGTSTGECLLNVVNATSHRDNVTYIGVDESYDMIKVAESNVQKLEGTKDNDLTPFVLLTNEDVLSVDYNNTSLVTSVLVAQFISIEKRKKLFNKIYNGLNEGAAFILVEKVLDENSYISDMYNQLYMDFKLSEGLDKAHLYDKSASLRGVMKPTTLEQNLIMLNNAGFKYQNISTFFKYNNFAGIIAIK